MNKTLKNEFKFTQDGDKWGHCMAWAFALCDYLTVQGQCPAYWDFNQSPCGPSEEDYQYQMIESFIENGDCTIDDLLEFSKILYRLYNILKAQGKDY